MWVCGRAGEGQGAWAAVGHGHRGGTRAHSPVDDRRSRVCQPGGRAAIKRACACVHAMSRQAGRHLVHDAHARVGGDVRVGEDAEGAAALALLQVRKVREERLVGAALELLALHATNDLFTRRGWASA